MESPTTPRLPVRNLWLGAAPGAWIPWQPHRVWRGVFHGAIAGSAALVIAFAAPMLRLPDPRLGDPRWWIALAVLGALHGSAIGLMAGLGWRLFALIVGPFAFAALPLFAAFRDGSTYGIELAIAVIWMIAGCIASGWVFYVSRRQ